MSDDCIFKADLAPHVKYVPLYKIHGTQRYQTSSMCRYTTYTAIKDTQPQRWALWHCKNCCISYQANWPRSSTWAWDRSRTDVGRMYHPFARAKTQTMHKLGLPYLMSNYRHLTGSFFVFWFFICVKHLLVSGCLANTLTFLSSDFFICVSTCSCRAAWRANFACGMWVSYGFRVSGV